MISYQPPVTYNRYKVFVIRNQLLCFKIAQNDLGQTIQPPFARIFTNITEDIEAFQDVVKKNKVDKSKRFFHAFNCY